MIALRLAGSGGKEIFVEDDKELELKPIYTAAAPKVPPIPSVRCKLIDCSVFKRPFYSSLASH